MTGDIYWPNGYILGLLGPFVESRDVALVVRIDNIGVTRVRNNKSALTTACRIPILTSDDSSIAGAGDSDICIVLLCSVDAVREPAVRRDVIKLRSWLIVERSPAHAYACGIKSRTFKNIHKQ